jgi:hypothetical protein
MMLSYPPTQKATSLTVDENGEGTLHELRKGVVGYASEGSALTSVVLGSPIKGHLSRENTSPLRSSDFGPHIALASVVFGDKIIK